MNMKAKFAEAVNFDEDLIFPKDKTRKEPFATARFVYFKIMLDKGYSPTEIAKETGYARTSIIYGAKRADELISIKDPLMIGFFEKAKNIKI